MGAETFIHHSAYPDPDQAFKEAVNDAAYDHGHAGYTGTIAEKDSFTIITHAPLDFEAAEELADQLICAADPRINDKWGPAGAIPYAVTGKPDDLTDRTAVEAWLESKPPIAGWVFFGWASS